MDKPAFVIDNGTSMIKCGLAGNEAPTLCIQNVIGEAKYKKVMSSAHYEKYYIGNKMKKCRGILRLKYPVERGVVTNFQDQERIWRHLYDQLNVKFEEQPLLFTAGACHPRRNKEKICEIMYESFNVPSLFFSLPPILSLYAYGEVTGCVVDCGEGMTQALCIYQGFQVQNSVKRIDLGGKDVTDHLMKLLRESGNVFHTSSEWEIVREIKEDRKVMYVCRDYGKENYLDEKGEIDTVDKKLPDGTLIKISSERYKAPDILFHPSEIGLEYPGVHELVVQSIKSSDIDIRSDLYSSILVSGGSTLFKDFNDRLLYDIRNRAPRDKKIILRSPVERRYTAWIGGALLASLTSFREMCTTQREYADHGMSVIYRKSFV